MVTKKTILCPKCGKSFVYDVYKEGLASKKEITRALEVRLDKHQLHFCQSCPKEFATCKGNPIFGDCVGNDNVVWCDSHPECQPEETAGA